MIERHANVCLMNQQSVKLKQVRKQEYSLIGSLKELDVISLEIVDQTGRVS
ncbi:hypothetical protein DPMN_073327 [Dreissena polymorpha]|uniref:Uncharacterized protein n=1 Tax=Dreissena polymorpha TaxID=45954 RepID=A0A9D4HDT9_DREPO|nr:hypothetical protein DPMN_073327 [Dreissena polymorpha]